MGAIRGSSTSVPISDALVVLADNADPSKQVRFEVGAIEASATRVITVPNQDVNLTPGTTFAAAGGAPAGHAATHKGGGSDAIDNATGVLAGLMSAADKTKLDGIETLADVTDTDSVLAALVGTDVAVDDITIADGLALAQRREYEGTFGLTMELFRVFDQPYNNPSTIPNFATNRLGLIAGTYLTSAPTVETEDVKTLTVTEHIRFQFRLPDNYVDETDVTLRLHAGMKTTVAGTSAEIDAQVVCQTVDPTADLNGTAAQSINDLTAANKDFVIAGATLVPGAVIDVIVSIAVVDVATATAVIGQLQIAKSALLIYVR